MPAIEPPTGTRALAVTAAGAATLMILTGCGVIRVSPRAECADETARQVERAPGRRASIGPTNEERLCQAIRLRGCGTRHA